MRGQSRQSIPFHCEEKVRTNNKVSVCGHTWWRAQILYHRPKKALLNEEPKIRLKVVQSINLDCHLWFKTTGSMNHINMSGLAIDSFENGNNSSFKVQLLDRPF